MAHYRPKWAVAAYLAQLRAAGEKLAVEELRPKPLPEPRDGTARFRQANYELSLSIRRTSLVDTNQPKALEIVAPGKARIGWARAEITDGSGRRSATNSWPEVESALAEKQALLGLLRALPQRPAVNLNLDYAQGFSLPLPHLSQVMRAAQLLSTDALCALHRGDAESAAADVYAVLALVKAWRDEPLVVSQLVRTSIAQLTFAATWSLWQSPAVTDKQLGAVQRNWSELEFMLATESALAMERAMVEETLEQMRDSSREFRKVASGFVPTPVGIL